MVLVTGSCLLSADALSQTEPGIAAQEIPMKIRILPEAPSSSRDREGYLLPGADPENRLGVPFLKHFGYDQKQFWTSPGRLDKTGSTTFAGFIGFTSLLIGGDSWISKQVPDKPDQLKRSQNISNYAVYSLIGAGGGAYLLGKIKNNDHMSETGMLSGEAALNSTAIAYLLKAATQRPRPTQDNGNGTFFHGGSSFPSEHSAVAWSIASVVAHEYPGPLTKFLAYGLASTVTLTRVTGKQHFASDAFVGSALGWYLGRQIYRAHHDPELGGAPWGDFIEAKEKGPRNPANMGSPYVPSDSWVYPALERLAALGYVRSAHLGIRPWTRMECVRLIEEAGERMQSDGRDQDNSGQQILLSLAEEFSNEAARLEGAPNLGMSLDSVYTRFTGISGKPLNDGFHFGQTVINDYGRPYGEGFNNVVGFTSHAVVGPLSFSLRGEYQHAPGVQSDPQSVLDATAAADGTLPLPNGHRQIDRFQLLDSTVAVTFANVQLSFGKQSLWLGPTEAGPFLFSNNATPVTMLKIDTVSPFQVPLLSKALGPVRSQFFLARLSGQQWAFSPPSLLGPNLASQPYIHGTKFSFHPTPNLEFGIGFTAQFGGTGNPFTWNNFLKSFYSHRSAGPCCNPAKRLSAFDFTYRVPGIRDWLQIYIDSMVIDEYSPLGSNRPAINPGVYFPRFPKIPKLDLRLEGVTDDLNVPDHFGNGAFYWDSRYRSGYVNDGNPIGSWIGRRGRGEQGWLTYHFSPRSNLQFGFRHTNVDKGFLNGGTLRDFSLRTDMMLSHNCALSAFVQQENWHFPVLSPSAKSNVTVSVQITYWPRLSKRAHTGTGADSGSN
jgi:hypothetical protein